MDRVNNTIRSNLQNRAFNVYRDIILRDYHRETLKAVNDRILIPVPNDRTTDRTYAERSSLANQYFMRLLINLDHSKLQLILDYSKMNIRQVTDTDRSNLWKKINDNCKKIKTCYAIHKENYAANHRSR